MITLKEAIKLCGEEMVYLQTEENRKDHILPESYLFPVQYIKNRFDMKAIKVTKIEPLFDRFGPDFMGMLFVVTGITAEKLRKEELRKILK